jgi:cytochrome c oxidase assembly protein subunit 11
MTTRKSRNRPTALALAAVAAAMVGLSFAAVPLYRVFCQVTGFGGTTQVADRPSREAPVLDRRITLTLDSAVNATLPWRFEPAQGKIRLRVGEQVLAHYRAVNLSREAVTGVATFNVTPFKAGPYFNKVACFCFTEQTLKPGESVDMPVAFFIDPAIAEDRNLDDVTDITLSYTFFRAAKTASRDTPSVAGAIQGDAESFVR